MCFLTDFLSKYQTKRYHLDNGNALTRHQTRHGASCLYQTRHGASCLYQTRHGDSGLYQTRHGASWLYQTRHGASCLYQTRHGDSWLYQTRHGDSCLCQTRHGDSGLYQTALSVIVAHDLTAQRCLRMLKEVYHSVRKSALTGDLSVQASPKRLLCLVELNSCTKMARKNKSLEDCH